MSRIEFVPVARGIFLEGMAIDGHTVWFGDVLGGGLHRIEPDDSVTTFLPEQRSYGSIAINEDGSLLTSGVDGIQWLNPKTGESGMLLTEVDGQQLPGVNELCSDDRGGLYFGTKDSAALAKGITDNPPGPTGLYHLSVDGLARQLCDDLLFTNGIAVSPDGTMLCHNETFVGTFAYPILQSGELGKREQLLDKPDCDGIALDVDGNLWVVGFASTELLCLSPKGEILARVQGPGGPVNNLRFGGDGQDLYVTTVPTAAGESLAAGAPPTELNSVMYRGRSPIVDRVNGQTGFRLDNAAAS